MIGKKNVQIVLLVSIFNLCCLFHSLLGQDVHQSNYAYAPHWLSPATVGMFQGDVRFGASYRSQFSNFIVKPYQTQQIFGEYSFSSGFTEGDWSTIGACIFRDQAGDLEVLQQALSFTYAYHFVVDKDYENVISFGVQYSTARRELDRSKAIFSSDLRGSSNNFDRNRLGDLGGSSSGLSFGLSAQHVLPNESVLSYGMAFYHSNSSEWDGLRTGNNKPKRFNLFANAVVPVHYQLSYSLGIVTSVGGSAFVAMPQFRMIHSMDRKKRDALILYYGLGYRLQDALQFMLGLGLSGWEIGVTYDMTISQAATYTNYYGGH